MVSASRRLFLSLLLATLSIGNAAAFDAVFYCTYQTSECTDAGTTVSVPPAEMAALLKAVGEVKENFIGFIDEEKTVVQFFVDKPNLIWFEIPDLQRQGSYGKHLTQQEFEAFVLRLEPPFQRFLGDPGMEFVPWQ